MIGLKVSQICFGTMTFGSQAGEAASFQIMDAACREPYIRVQVACIRYKEPQGTHRGSTVFKCYLFARSYCLHPFKQGFKLINLFPQFPFFAYI